MWSKRVIKLGSVLLLSVALAACGSTEEKRKAYLQSRASGPLEMPPLMEQPDHSNALEVPVVKEEAQQAAPAGAGQPVVSSVVAEVSLGLPGSKKVEVARDGALQWLVIKEEPARVWPKVMAYWKEYGPAVKSSSEEFMTMDTEWAELGEDKKKSSFFRKLFSKLYSSSTRDKFRVRLEKGKEPGTTELHLAHQRMQQMMVDDNPRWMPAPADRELEIEMLKRLMVYLGLDKEQAQVLLFQPDEVKYDLQSDKGRTYLEIEAPRGWVWQRLGHAIDRAEMQVKESNSRAGYYDVLYTQVSREQETGFDYKVKEIREEYPVRLQLKVTENGAELDALDEAGKPLEGDKAKPVLKALLKQLD